MLKYEKHKKKLTIHYIYMNAHTVHWRMVWLMVDSWIHHLAFFKFESITDAACNMQRNDWLRF